MVIKVIIIELLICHVFAVKRMIPFTGEDVCLVMEDLQSRFLNSINPSRWTAASCAIEESIFGKRSQQSYKGIGPTLDILHKMLLLKSALVQKNQDKSHLIADFVMAGNVYDNMKSCLVSQVNQVKALHKKGVLALTSTTLNTRLEELTFLKGVFSYVSLLPPDNDIARSVFPEYILLKQEFVNAVEAISRLAERALLSLSYFKNIHTDGEPSLSKAADVLKILELLISPASGEKLVDDEDSKIIRHLISSLEGTFRKTFFELLTSLRQQFKIHPAKSLNLPKLNHTLGRIDSMLDFPLFSSLLYQSDEYRNTMKYMKETLSTSYQYLLHYISDCHSVGPDKTELPDDLDDHMNLVWTASLLLDYHPSNTYSGEYKVLTKKIEEMENRIVSNKTTSCHYLDVFQSVSIIGCLRGFPDLNADGERSTTLTTFDNYKKSVNITLWGIVKELEIIIQDVHIINPVRLKCSVLYYFAALPLRDNNLHQPLWRLNELLSEVDERITTYSEQELSKSFKELYLPTATTHGMRASDISSRAIASTINEALDVSRRLIDIFETEKSALVSLGDVNSQGGTHDFFRSVFYHRPLAVLNKWTYRRGNSYVDTCSASHMRGELVKYLCLLRHYLDTGTSLQNYDAMIEVIGVAKDCDILDKYLPPDAQYSFSSLSQSYSKKLDAHWQSHSAKVKQFIAVGDYSSLGSVLQNASADFFVRNVSDSLQSKIHEDIQAVERSLEHINNRWPSYDDIRWSEILSDIKYVSQTVLNLACINASVYERYLGLKLQRAVLDRTYNACNVIKSMVLRSGKDMDVSIQKDDFVAAEQLILNMSSEIAMIFEGMPCRESMDNFSYYCESDTSRECETEEQFASLSLMLRIRSDRLSARRNEIVQMYGHLSLGEMLLLVPPPKSLLGKLELAGSYNAAYLDTRNQLIVTINDSITYELQNQGKYSMELLENTSRLLNIPCVDLLPACICPSLAACVGALNATHASHRVDFERNMSACSSNGNFDLDCLFQLHRDVLIAEHYREAASILAMSNRIIEDIAGRSLGADWNSSTLGSMNTLWKLCRRHMFVSDNLILRKQSSQEWKYNGFENYSNVLMKGSDCRQLSATFPGHVVSAVRKYHMAMEKALHIPSDSDLSFADMVMGSRELTNVMALVDLRASVSSKSLFVTLRAIDRSVDLKLEELCNYTAALLETIPVELEKAMKSGTWHVVNSILSYARNIDTIHTHGVAACGAVYEAYVANATTYVELVRHLEYYIDSVASFLLQDDYIDSAGVFSQDVDIFYSRVVSSYDMLHNVNITSNHLCVNASVVDIDECGIATLQESCRIHIREEYQLIADRLHRLIDMIPSDDTAVYSNFHLLHKSLSQLSAIASMTSEIRGTIVTVDNLFNQSYDGMVTKLQDFVLAKEWGHVAETLLELYRVMEHIGVYENENLMPVVIRVVNAMRPDEANEVAGILDRETESQALADKIISSLDAFEGYALTLYYERINMSDADSILRDITVWELATNGSIVEGALPLVAVHSHRNLVHHWGSFSKLYSTLLENGHPQLRTTALRHLTEGVTYDQQVIGAMACVFATWTLSHSFRQLRPTPAQVLAIFRLLGVDKSNQDWFNSNYDAVIRKYPVENHLIQILTGEGKSVTLAVASIVLALLGYHVDTVTYSELLRNRDHNAFKKLFEAYWVQDMISYGTYDDLFSGYLNKNGNIRDLTVATLTNTRSTYFESFKRSTEKSRVLLLDEVDVFFDKLFYSKPYNCLAILHGDKDIEELVTFIWNHRATVTLEFVTTQNVYKKVLEKFDNFKVFINSEVSLMIRALSFLANDKYKIRKMEDGINRIGYVRDNEDTININVCHGYTTMWAHFKEYSANNIEKWVRDLSIGLLLSCGSFSYAEVPKSYAHILGTTGTLSTLSKNDVDMIFGPYNIRSQTFIPSVHGLSRLKWNCTTDVTIASDDMEFRESLSKHVREHRQASFNGVTLYRPVLIIFDSEENLLAYYNSHEFKILKKKTRVGTDSVHIITETITTADREHAMRNAVKQASITLLTKAYGRGTDFICHDDEVDAAGGVHVVQTYFTDSYSEEIQNRGRTARQGHRGSFYMVLNLAQLQTQFQRSDSAILDIIQDSTSAYDKLDKLRAIVFEERNEDNLSAARKQRDRHDEAVRFLEAVTKEPMTAKALDIFKSTI